MNREPLYVYSHICHEDEDSLRDLELRVLFGQDAAPGLFVSGREVDPDRSPFLKERIEVLVEGDDIASVAKLAARVQVPEGATFKVVYVKNAGRDDAVKISYDEQRAVEREIGRHIVGKADMKQPDYRFGIAACGGRWYFGHYRRHSSVWLSHKHKPQHYSIALPVRLARALVNMAVPEPDGVKAIDPCCGIGTVLVEALSMGLDITGRDINPLAVHGARDNIAHFGLRGEVRLGSIAEETGHYDAAIVDLPYNLASRSSRDEQLFLLRHTRRIAARAVVVSLEPIDDLLGAAGFVVRDRCVASKGSFSRHVAVCE
ncbi:TRM11 family SAM-dependent methyltransferase [Paenibacillus ginsengarvi]|uniref:RNA methyltransferase n=1 Tax=Paenibacillus ginsengarvi TaxID=400777 RepID=A0A3B0BLZ8_9BACL|nr:RNA methyltransferase [Paenibacillus ginsengarvi]RKN74192.1 RNA methyltransferase [Paenibacillus ginsengarvi]